MEKKLRILFLTPRFPFPLIGGDRIKSYYLLKYLANRHEVTLVTFNHKLKPSIEQVDGIKKLNVKLHYIILNPIKAAFKSFINLFKYPLEINFYLNNKFKNKVNSLLETNQFDLAVSFFMRTAEYLKNKDIKKLLIAEDCRILYQERSYKAPNNLLQKFVRFFEFKSLKKYEPETYNKFNMISFVSDNDIETAKSINQNLKYGLLSNGVNLENYKFNGAIDSKEDIVFVGKMDIWSNVLMVKTIVSEILPKIIKFYPNIKLKIIGSNPPKEITKLKSESVEIYSDVPDVIPYLSSGRIFIHPHNAATGIQNKILEAMAVGCPIVTSPSGIQGINAIHNVHLLISNNLVEFVENSLLLLGDKDLSQKLISNSRELIEKEKSWNNIYVQMDNILEELFQDE